MFLKKWQELPQEMKNDFVSMYYDILKKKRMELFIKRLFDVFGALILLIFLFFPMLLIAVLIKMDSPGSVFFKQERVTQYGDVFKILKFRTMVNDAKNLGPEVTCDNDIRVTRAGKFLRKFRLDELPQLINILFGQMSFVGTRPETVKYVKSYTDEMKATLLLPAGVTSLASIEFKDEAKILENGLEKDKGVEKDIEEVYVKEILPQKMKFNLEYIKEFNFFYDLKIMIKTLTAVIKE